MNEELLLEQIEKMGAITRSFLSLKESGQLTPNCIATFKNYCTSHVPNIFGDGDDQVMSEQLKVRARAMKNAAQYQGDSAHGQAPQVAKPSFLTWYREWNKLDTTEENPELNPYFQELYRDHCAKLEATQKEKEPEKLPSLSEQYPELAAPSHRRAIENARKNQAQYETAEEETV